MRLILPLLLSTPQPESDMQIAKMHVYEVRPRKDKRGVDVISEVLPFGRLVVRLNMPISAEQKPINAKPFRLEKGHCYIE
jgi:hypothetical protein